MDALIAELWEFYEKLNQTEKSVFIELLQEMSINHFVSVIDTLKQLEQRYLHKLDASEDDDSKLLVIKRFKKGAMECLQ